MDEIKQITWDDLSISQVQRITAITGFKASSINKCLDMLSVIYRKERTWFEEEIDAVELHRYLNILANLLETTPDLNFERFAEYEIWENKWQLCISAKQMTAGQFISFNTILEEQPNNIGLLLAMVLTPKGGEFGLLPNGNKYDPQELASHLNDTFPFTKARAIANFFWQASLASRVLTLRSTRKELMMQKKQEKERAKREILKQSIAKVNQDLLKLKQITKVAI